MRCSFEGHLFQHFRFSQSQILLVAVLLEFFVLFFSGFRSLALTPSSSSKNVDFQTYRQVKKSSSIRSELGLQQQELISPDFWESKDRDFTSVEASLNQGLNEAERADSGLILDINGKYTLAHNSMSYLNISQMAWSSSVLTLGRRKLQWSRLDDIWNLGLFQPLFRAQPLQPESQGLSGVFLDLKNSGWGVKFFGSFLFIPDQGPSYELKNGHFEASNPWFQNPPQVLEFQGQSDRIQYEINKPDASEIIFNRSFVGQFYAGDILEGWYFETAFANKPSNQLVNGMSGYLTAQDTAIISVNPKIYYHTLGSAELSFATINQAQTSRFAGGILGSFEKPEQPTFDEKLFYVYYSPSTLLSPFMKWEFGSFQVQTSYLSIQGADLQQQGDLARASVNNTSKLGQRYPFREAWKAQISAQQVLKRSRLLREKLDLIEGANQQFSQVGWGAELELDSCLKFSLAFIFIKTDESLESQKTIFGQYENRDLMTAAVAYVF